MAVQQERLCTHLPLTLIAIVLHIHLSVANNNWITFGTSKYLFTDNQDVWVNSRSHCASMNAELVVIDSPEENEFIADELASKGNFKAWLGYTCTATRTWDVCDGETAYTNWVWLEPTNDGECAVVHESDGVWYILECNENFNIPNTVCEISDTSAIPDPRTSTTADPPISTHATTTTSSIPKEQTNLKSQLKKCFVLGTDGRFPTL